jgi:hypothetical protein
VNICHSSYSPRRTGCHDYFLNDPDELDTTTVRATERYFENAGTPGCKAGLRFLVVTSDGALQP